jgi:predicted ATPase
VEEQGRLQRIKIEGFRSIRALKLDLGPINILIGPNGAGKSNFIAFFDFMYQLQNRNLAFNVQQQGGASKVLHFGSKTTQALECSLDFAPNSYVVKLVPDTNDALIFESEYCYFDGSKATGYSSKKTSYALATPGSRESSLPQELNFRYASSWVVHHLSRWRKYHFHDTSESANIKKSARTDQTQMLLRDGENLAPFLRHVRDTASTHYDRIVSTIQRVAPFFLDFVLDPEGKDGKFMRLRWRHRGSDTIFDASDFSDGTLRFICLATLFLQPNMPKLILLDEPELGLHPFALVLLAGLIRSVSDTTQVIASTQSVTFANQFAAEDIIVVDQIDNASEFSRLDLERLKVWLTDYGVGELWEKNLLGGTP